LVRWKTICGTFYEIKKGNSGNDDFDFHDKKKVSIFKLISKKENG
jgi:hypothetical protein